VTEETGVVVVQGTIRRAWSQGSLGESVPCVAEITRQVRRGAESGRVLLSVLRIIVCALSWLATDDTGVVVVRNTTRRAWSRESLAGPVCGVAEISRRV
jgi:hypothetical protein